MHSTAWMMHLDWHNRLCQGAEQCMYCDSKYLGNIVDPEQGVSDEQGLYRPQLMGGLHMARPIERSSRVSSHHVIESLQSLSFLCSLCILQPPTSEIKSAQEPKNHIVYSM